MTLKQLILIFLDFVGINLIFRFFNSNKAIILSYHGICDENFRMLKGYDERHIPKSIFKKQLLYLINKGYQFVTISELVLLLKEKKNINKIVALTFDDGFRNVIENAYPVMKEMNAKGCIYLVSNLISEQNLLWTDFVEMAVRNNKSKTFEFIFKEKVLHYSLETKKSCEIAIKDIKEKLRAISDIERKEYLKQFYINTDDMKNVPKEFLPARWGQIQNLDKSILEVGSHTRNHPNCANLTSEEEFESELNESKSDIEKQLGHPINSFCYPSGSYNNKVVDYIKKYGYQSAASTIPGFNCTNTSLFELKRISTTEDFWLFKAMVSGSYFFLADMLQLIKVNK
jgi:peptidoglycan/xylan/chitin deacetylase (PgdA/CDA1 family)